MNAKDRNASERALFIAGGTLDMLLVRAETPSPRQSVPFDEQQVDSCSCGCGMMGECDPAEAYDITDDIL